MGSKLDCLIRELAEYLIYGEENIKNAYQKEKIVKVDRNMKNINEIFKKFKNIERSTYWKTGKEEIFYRQAKLLEDFEDNYQSKEISRYSLYSYRGTCTYSWFTIKDFRIYFSWRTKIRKGIFERIDFDYDQIYINELLNKIGCLDADDAINKLITFWSGYRKYSQKLDGIMPNIIKEFYVLNNINVEYEEITAKYPITIRSLSKDLKDIKNEIYSGKLEFFSIISTYQIAKSKFLETKYGYLLNKCIEKVFNRIHKEFGKIDIYLPELLMYENYQGSNIEIFSRYTIYDVPREDKTVTIEGTQKYECKNGEWRKTIYSTLNIYKNTIGYLLKTMEYYVRDYLGYRKLKLPAKSEVLRDIDEYYCSNKKRSRVNNIFKLDLENIVKTEVIYLLKSLKIPQMALKKKKENQEEPLIEEKIDIVFDKNQFAKIREKSEEIQKALIIEEVQEKEQIKQTYKETAKPIVEMQETKENANENVFKTFVDVLTDGEKEVVQVLLQKQDTENKMLQIAKKQNEMLEVVVSNINNKALETIGDTIIESNMTSIYEDYENEIKQVL